MKNNSKLIYCTKCLNPHTRPRITFNEEGICNACSWQLEKKKIDWDSRWNELEKICDKYRTRNKDQFDVIVPYSGGKDGAFIAYNLREKLGMTPLCITIRPPMEDPIGQQNILNFLDKGFDHVHITPNRKVERAIDKDNFINYGRPMGAFMMVVQAAIFRSAITYDIPFVMFAEEGETEYGGSSKLKNSHTYDVDDSINFYLSGVNPRQYLEKFSEKELYWYLHPEKKHLKNLGVEICHWSYFKEFVNYEHYLIAKDKLGLLERDTRSSGTYENYSTTDTNLIWLYFYLMYLKFGFGRTTNVVGTDIRRGSMTRKQAINLVKKFDGEMPVEYMKKYQEWYDMSENELSETIDKWANKDLFVKNNEGLWRPTFDIY